MVWLQGRGSARRGKRQSTSVPRILTDGKTCSPKNWLGSTMYDRARQFYLDSKPFPVHKSSVRIQNDRCTKSSSGWMSTNRPTATPSAQLKH